MALGTRRSNTLSSYISAWSVPGTLLLHQKEFQKTAIILGNGGAAKAVQFVLKKNNIPYITVSRTTEVNYENLTEDLVKENLIIIQCTPVGTFPNVEDCVAFPFEAITEKHLIIDLIYNPEYSKFIKKAAEIRSCLRLFE